MRFTTTHFFAVFGLHLASTLASPVARRETHQVADLDFNDMFDGSLGTLPAMWLVSQGALAAFKTANSTHLPDRPGSDLLDELIKSPTRLMGNALCLATSELLEEIGVKLARRVHFAQQLRELLQLSELHGLARTVQHLTREMTRQMHALSDLVADAVALTAAEAALASLALLAVESTAVLGIVKVVPLKVPSNPALENLQTITLHLSATVELVASLPETAALAQGLRSGVEALHDQVTRQVKEQNAEDPDQEQPDDEHPEDEENGDGPDNVGVPPPPPPPPPPEQEPPPPPPEEECWWIEICFIVCVPVKKCP